MYPDTFVETKTSQPERVIFTKILSQLDNSYTVLHSLKIYDNIEAKLIGEADFVVISPNGILFIEVKGRIDYSDGYWNYNYGIESKRTTESPLMQSQTAMFAVRENLKTLLKEEGMEHLLTGVPWGCSAISTQSPINSHSTELPRDICKGIEVVIKDDGVRNFIVSVQSYWKNKHIKSGKIFKALSNENIDLIYKKIRGFQSVVAATHNDLITLTDQKIVEATKLQAKILRGVDAMPRLILSGRAGTGKTAIATTFATRALKEGKKVLFLCYNKNLADHIRKFLSPEINVTTAHAFYLSAIKSANAESYIEEYGSNLNDFFDVLPKIYRDIAYPSIDDKYDVVIVDEAQDLMNIDHIQAIAVSVKGGLESGNIKLFYDPIQNIYGKLTDDVLDLLYSEYFFARFELLENCRNSREVATMANVISEVNVPINEDISTGSPLSPKYVKKISAAPMAIKNIINELSSTGVTPENIIILSPRTLDNSVCKALVDEGILGLWGESSANPVLGYFSTIHGFKGLDSGAVILVDIDLESETTSQLLIYVASTRAKAFLCPILLESNKGRYEKLTENWAIRLANIV